MPQRMDSWAAAALAIDFTSAVLRTSVVLISER
jgi:hypothetical protein